MASLDDYRGVAISMQVNYSLIQGDPHATLGMTTLNLVMYSISKLKNNITLIRVPVAGTKAVTVLAMYPVGSRYEEKRISGISHFVEHLMFKGTAKRPTTLDISRSLDAVGAQYNAFTSKEYTGYYIKIAGEQQELAFDILSDILFHSKFDSKEIEKEKGAIVEELRMYRDNPLMDIETLFENNIFGDNALGWDIGGTDESVRGMTRDDLYGFYQRHYSPQNMVLVLAGDVESEKIKLLNEYFESQISPVNATDVSYYADHFEKVMVNNISKRLEDRVRVKQKAVDQTQFIMGFPGFKTDHQDRFVLAILSTILGGGMSSRLFTEVREKRGLAYMVRASQSHYRETGAFYMQAGLDPKRLAEAVKVIREELEKIKTEIMEEKELEDAKNHIAGSLALQMEDSHEQAQWYAEKFLFFPTIETPEHIAEELKHVTVQDVQRVARELLVFDQAYYATIGAYDTSAFLKCLE